MLTRPTRRPPQTLQQAKAEYKKYGPRISSQELRQLERGEELFRRAEKIKEAEKRRNAALKRKREKEQNEKEARRRMGIAVPPAKIRRSQEVLEKFMTGMRKPGHAGRAPSEELPVQEKQAQRGVDVPEPWEDEIDDGSLIDVVLLPKAQSPKTPSFEMRGTFDNDNLATPTPTALDLDYAWDDLLISNTQVLREMKSKPEEHVRSQRPMTATDTLLSSISTQDVTLSTDDLEELGLDQLSSSMERNAASMATARELDRVLMPPPPTRPKAPTQPSLLMLSSDISFFDFDLSTQDFPDIFY